MDISVHKKRSLYTMIYENNNTWIIIFYIWTVVSQYLKFIASKKFVIVKAVKIGMNWACVLRLPIYADQSNFKS